MELQLIQGTGDEPQPLQFNATWFQKKRSRARDAVGRLLNLFKLPAFIRPMKYNDPVTGNDIEITISPTFTRVNVNGRDYYFNRLTGAFDGTGQASC